MLNNITKIISNAKYEKTAVTSAQYPISQLPEIVFLGRSNVGKSSLLNCLLNRKNLARIGSTPGKTRGINFYNVGNKMYFVDLPGYGYAHVSKKEKESWSDMIETYLNTREQIILAVMLVDIRHSPSAQDKVMYDWLLRKNKSHIIAATKLDKISKSQHPVRIQDIRNTLRLENNIAIIPFSSLHKEGREQLWNEINKNLGG